MCPHFERLPAPFRDSGRVLVARALLSFLALPGVFAFAIPIGLLGLTGQTQVAVPAGMVLLVIGAAGLLWCVRDFLVAGRGTLAPWDPPHRLVVVGLYRVSRNPMYLAVLVLLAGWTVTFGSWPLAGYSAVVAVAFHLRVVLGEEPWLEREFGDQWRGYAARVPRWFGRVGSSG